MTPMTPSRRQEVAGTDDELSGLLLALRRHILVPEDAWQPEVVEAARRVTAAIAARLDQPDEARTEDRPRQRTSD